MLDTWTNLITNPSQFSSPYSQNDWGSRDGGNLADGVLIDHDYSSYWHSYWGGGSVDPGTHYLQVEIPELPETWGFSFTRRNTDNDHTTIWSVYYVPADKPDATREECTFVALVETPFGSKDETLYSNILTNNIGATIVRFYSEEQYPNSRGYFHIAEFAIHPAVEKDEYEDASATSPKNVTNFIKNPNYTEGSANWEGGLGTGDNVANYWNVGTEPFDFYQTLTNLPNGVYQVQVHSAHRIGGSGNYGAHYESGVLDPYKQYLRTCQIYANNYWTLNNDITSENIKEDLGDAYWDYEMLNGYYIPLGTSYVASAYNNLNMFDNSLFCVVTDGILKIGVRCQDRMAGSWTSFDKWRLTYYGSGDDALELLKSELAESLPDYEEEIVQASLKETYSTALKALEDAADFAAAEAAYTKAISLFYDIEKSRETYNNFINFIAEVEPQTEGLNNEAADVLINYLEKEFKTILETTPYNAEELEAEMQKVKDMLDAAIKGAIEAVSDISSLIPNHDMKQASFQDAGWVITPADVNIKGNKDKLDKYDTQYHMGEAWQFSTFDMSYTLTNMPAGTYELEIPALYRNRYHNYENPAPVEIYMNDQSINIKTAKDDAISEADAISTEFEPGDGYKSPDEWKDANCYNINSQWGDTSWPNDQILTIDGQRYYIPGSCDGAAVAFYAGRYINKAYGVVGEDGILKLGIRTTENTGLADQWVAIGHIKMTYMGNVEKTIKGDANGDEAIDTADIAATANYILGDTVEDFVKEAADMDEDDMIDVADIAGIANIILYENGSSMKAQNKVVACADAAIPSLGVDSFQVESGTATASLTLNLSNAGYEICGFQCDMYLPEGIGWEENSLGTLSVPTFNAETDRTTHIVSAALQTDGAVRILCYSNENKIFLGEDGAILNLPITFEDDLAEGTYKVVIKNIVLTTPTASKVTPAETTFEITICEPAVVITLADGTVYNNEETQQVSKFTYTRNFDNTEWLSLYLPAAVPVSTLAEQGLHVAYINNFNQYDTDGDHKPDQLTMEVFIIDEGTLLPNYPYMVKAVTTGEKEIVVENTEVMAADEVTIGCSSMTFIYEVTGTYHEIPASELPSNGYYVVSDGNQLTAGNTDNLSPERWYLKITPRPGTFTPLPNEVKIEVVGEGVYDGIHGFTALDSSAQDAIYDLSGRQVSKAQKGIYIQSGKKLFIK